MSVGIDGVVETLLAADESSVVLATRRDVLGEDGRSAMVELGERVRDSTRARALIAGVPPGPVYRNGTAPIGCWRTWPIWASRLGDRTRPAVGPGLDEWLKPGYFKE